MAAYGAREIYGAPVLVLDYGTALTCDYVSKRGIFEGGLIIPGPEISLTALTERTALLPAVPFPSHYYRLIGCDTKSCMQAGILQGYGAMADGLIGRFRTRYGRGLKAVLTGGLARSMAPFVTQADVIDPLLILKSLGLLYYQYQAKKIKSS